MKNKIAVGISVLLLGFLLGGVSFYFLGKVTGQHKGFVTLTPNVPKQIADSSKAFSEIASSISPSVVNISTTKIMKREACTALMILSLNFSHRYTISRCPKSGRSRVLVPV